jgi:hypothetical protein
MQLTGPELWFFLELKALEPARQLILIVRQALVADSK